MRKVIFAINITTDGYCSHTDMIATEESLDFFTVLLRNASILLFGHGAYRILRLSGARPSAQFRIRSSSSENVVYTR